MPLLASDFSGLALYFLVIAGFGLLLGIVALAINLTIGHRRWWGLLAAAPPLVWVGYLAWWEISNHGDGTGFWFVGTLPLLLGIGSLLAWFRPRRVK